MGHECRNARRLLVAYIVVNAVLYSILLPLWEGFDEPFHFASVQHLANGQGWPDPRTDRVSKEVAASLMLAPASHVVQQNIPQVTTYARYFAWPGRQRENVQRQIREIPWQTRWQPADILNYEAQHPPLAYLLLALPERLLARVPIPYRVAFLRVIAAVAGALLLGLAAERLFAQLGIGDPYKAIALFCLFSSQMTWATLAHVANDWLAVPLAVWTLVALNRYLARPSPRAAAVAAGILAAGLLTKAYFLFFLPLCLGAWVWRRQWRALAAALCVLCALAGPWYVRNLVRYGVLSGTQEARAGVGFAAVLQAAPGLHWPAVIASSIRSALWTGNNSFLAFSAGTLDLMIGVGLAALLLWAVSRHSTAEWTAAWYCGLFALAIGYAATVSSLATRSGLAFAEPWYAQVLSAPLLGLMLLGACRKRKVGRFAAALFVLLFGYVLAATYAVKLIPLYGGYEARISPRVLAGLYTRQLGTLTANLESVTLVPAALVYALAAVVIVLVVAQQFVILRALRKEQDAG